MATRYKEIKGERHIWYVPMNVDPYKDLHVAFRHDQNGYAGRIIEFLLIDGTLRQVKGPYHCLNSVSDGNAFERDTGLRIDDLVVEYQLLEEDI